MDIVIVSECHLTLNVFEVIARDEQTVIDTKRSSPNDRDPISIISDKKGQFSHWYLT